MLNCITINVIITNNVILLNVILLTIIMFNVIMLIAILLYENIIHLFIMLNAPLNVILLNVIKMIVTVPLPQVTDDTNGFCKKDAIYFSCHKFVGGPQTPGILATIL